MSEDARLTPVQLARQLGISDKRLRGWLRATYPRSAVDHGQRWVLDAEMAAAARRRFR